MRNILLIITLSLVLAACNSIGTRQKGEGLVNSMDEYVAALRWGRFDSAKQYHLEKDQSTPEIDSSQLDYIRVTGHTIKKKDINEELDEASVERKMQCYHNEYGTLKKILIKQNWWYSEDLKRWFISSDFPKF